MVEPDRAPWERSSGPSPGRRWVLLGAVALAGLLAGWVFGFTANSAGSPTTTSEDQFAVPPTSTFVSPTTTERPTTVAPTTTVSSAFAPLRGRVEVLPGSLDLRGSVALAVPGPIGDQNLWLIEPGGRMIQRVEAHIRSSGDRYPMMIVGDYLLTPTSTGLFRMRLDLVDPAVRIAEPGYLIPDANPNRAWLVGGDLPEWFAPFNVETGEVGTRTELPRDFGWPFAGYQDGVLIHPQNGSAFGAVAYWPAGGEPSSLGLDLSVEAGIPSVVGHSGVIVAPGPSLAVVDLRTGERTSMLEFDPGEGNVIGVCLSEDAAYMAAISSAGVVEVFDVATGESRGRITTADPPFSVAWAASNQLVSIAEVEGASPLSLQLFNVSAGLVTQIARLETPGVWRIATTSRPC